MGYVDLEGCWWRRRGWGHPLNCGTDERALHRHGRCFFLCVCTSVGPVVHQALSCTHGSSGIKAFGKKKINKKASSSKRHHIQVSPAAQCQEKHAVFFLWIVLDFQPPLMKQRFTNTTEDKALCAPCSIVFSEALYAHILNSAHF